MSEQHISIINNIFKEYMQIKKTKEKIDEVYDSHKKIVLEILSSSSGKKIMIDNLEFKAQDCHRETVDDKGLSKWLIDNDSKELLNVVYKPNMELINGVFSSKIPQDVRDKYIKNTLYSKIVVSNSEES